MHIFLEKLGLSIVCNKCANEYLKIFKEKELIETLKTLKSISQSRIRLKNIDETKNNFIEEINQNELMSKKHKKFLGF